MTDFLESVRQALDPRTIVQHRLRKNGCTVRMAQGPNLRLIIDFDKPGSPLAPTATRCDYLVIAEDQHNAKWVAPLELKRGSLHANEVTKQLQAGANAAESFVANDEAVRFRPVAASGRVSKHERTKLKENRNMIRFHGRREPIRLISCGSQLIQILGI